MRKETFEKYPYFVIPAEAGIQKIMKRLDSRFRGNDDLDHIRINSKVSEVGHIIKVIAIDKREDMEVYRIALKRILSMKQD